MRLFSLAAVSLTVLALASTSIRANEVVLPPQNEPVVSAEPSAVAPAAEGDVSVLHRLNTDARQLRFEGETGTRVWPIFVTDRRTRTHARVHLAYTNAVSVMPEASRISVTINDVLVNESKIAASSDLGVIDVDIPEGVLEPGFNAFRISVQQRHRVDCSMSATYELWTQFDMAATGISFPALADEPLADLTDLAAVPPDNAGVTVIRAILPRDADPATLDRMMKAAQAVALRGGYGRPVVEVGDAGDNLPGISLYIATRDELAARGLAKDLGDSDSYFLRNHDKDGHYDLFITGATTAELDEAVNGLLASAVAEPPVGSAAGVAALVNQYGYHVAGNSRHTFRDLGLTNQEFSGHVFRTGFDMQMPADYYAADYGKMQLKLDGGYAPGLSAGSQILVRVNDHDVASLMLPKPGGDVLRKQLVSVPLSELRPGSNHIELEAQVSKASDSACDFEEMTDARKRFMLIDQSELILPSIARIAHFPNLSSTASDGFPFGGQTGPTRLFLARRDAATIGAAASFIVRAAVNGHHPLQTAVSFNRNDLDGGSALLIGAISDMPRELVENSGIDQAALKAAWARVGLERTNVPPDSSGDRTKIIRSLAAQGVSANSPAKQQKAALRQVQKKSTDTADLYAQWAGETGASGSASGISDWANGWFASARQMSSHALLFLKRSDDLYAPDQKSRIVVAQHQAPAGGSKTWTLVTAPSSEFLARGLRDLSAPTVWNQLSGRISTLDPKNNVVWSIQPEAEGYFIQTQPLAPANLRLVTAGWLSNNILFYVIGFLALSAVLGLMTNIVVRKSGTTH